MGYFIDASLTELSDWEKRALKFLLDRISREKVERLIEDYRQMPSGFHDKAKKCDDISASLCNAIIGLSIVRDLIELFNQPIPESFPAEDSARFSRNAFYAGMFIGMAIPGRGVEVLEYARKRAEEEGRRKGAVHAITTRHVPLNEFKEKAAAAARRLWASGSPLLHHQVVKYLTEEYQDAEGKHPFMHLPGDVNASPHKVLLETAKQVAREINRPDLISGGKKKRP